jgi:hypothetical protein
MKKALTIATFLTVIAMPAFATPTFAQSVDADLGTGNIVPPAATNQGGASAYAQAPDTYETGYSRSSMNRSGRTRKHGEKNMDAKPGTTDTDNTSVPGASVDKDDTTPKSR